MARMVENVIALSRVEDGRTQLRCQRLTTGNLLDQISGDLTACAEKAGLTLSIELGGIRDVALETDPAAVGQILLNLVENACKYGGSEERPAIRVGASVHDRTLKLTVRDHGPGVPPEVARRIFRPFERGEQQGSDPVRGLGLGLALSLGLARDLGGDLALENPADGGACFVVSLPVAG